MLASDLIADRYEIRRLLGSGGMGHVYLAFDQLLRRPVALKLFELGGSASAAEHFLREARMAARLSHPNVVTVHDVGTADGHAFIAMEYVEGRPLSELTDEPQSWTSVVALAREILKGLAYAHGRGVVHRDIKPSNLVRGEDGRVVILDLGISYAIEATTQTAPDGLMGTPAYMAPEQVRGETLDGRTDLFSLGVVLYHLLTGQSPFQAPGLSETLAQVLHRIPPAPSSLHPVPSEIDRFVLRLLAKSPGKRFASAEEALAALERCSESDLTVPVRPRHGRAAQRISLLLSGGLVLVIVSSFVAVLLSAPPQGTAGPGAPTPAPAAPTPAPAGGQGLAAPDVLAAAGSSLPAGDASPPQTTPRTVLPPEVILHALPALPAAAVPTPRLEVQSLALPPPSPPPSPTAAPTPALARLRIQTDRPADISIDDKLYGGQMRDLELELPPGRYKISASTRDGQFSHELSVTLAGHQTVVMPLAPPAPGRVRITPPRRMRVSVYVDDAPAPAAECPCSPLELPPGRHRLRFVNAETGLDRSETVVVQSGTTTSVEVRTD